MSTLRLISLCGAVCAVAVGVAGCGGSGEAQAPAASTASSEASAPAANATNWSAADVASAIGATSDNGRTWSFEAQGVSCQLFPALGTGERSDSGYTLEDYEKASNGTGDVVWTDDHSAGVRVQGPDGYSNATCTQAAADRLRGASPD